MIANPKVLCGFVAGSVFLASSHIFPCTSVVVQCNESFSLIFFFFFLQTSQVVKFEGLRQMVA